MTNLVWSITLAVIGLTGLWIAGQKNQYGWAIGLVVQVLWIIFAVTTGQYGFILSALGYGFVNARNWRKWYKENKTDKIET